MKYVYLCGPISGISYAACTGWRNKVQSELAHGVHGLDPMRCKEYLASEESIKHSYEAGAFPTSALLSSEKHFFARDVLDVRSSDIVLANFLGAPVVSMGSVSEMGMAHAQNIPILLCMEDEGNVHDHPFIRQMSAWRVNNLDDAVSVINATLGTMMSRRV